MSERERQRGVRASENRLSTKKYDPDPGHADKVKEFKCPVAEHESWHREGIEKGGYRECPQGTCLIRLRENDHGSALLNYIVHSLLHPPAR